MPDNTTLTVHIGDETFEFDPVRILCSEAEAIERATGWTFAEWGEKITVGSALALHALVWLLKNRQSSIRFSDVDFAFGDVTIEEPADAPKETPTPDPLDAPSTVAA